MFEVAFEGIDGIERALGTAAEGLMDFAVPMQRSLEVLSASVLENIAVSGRPHYPDVTPFTRAHRKFDEGTPPLWDSGAMADAATAARPGVEGSTYLLAPDGMFGQIGVEDEFHGAMRHQFGYRGWDEWLHTFVREPPRAFLVMQPEDRAAVVEIFDMYIAALAGKWSK